MTPKPPKHLMAPTRRWYAEVVDRYELEPHHLRLLQLAAEAWDRSQQARAAIGLHGLTTTNRYGAAIPRPEVAIERDARIAFARLVRELALDDDNEPTYGGMMPKRSNSKNWKSGGFDAEA